MSFHDINSYRLIDESPGTPLDKVFPFSKRAACLVVRRKSSALLKTNFFNIQGAVEMLYGLDYHHDHFMTIISHLAMIGDAKELLLVLYNEATAYMNRLGQFFYFINSDFVHSNCQGMPPFAPTIEKFVIFRHKHSAHRSIDFPKKESAQIQAVQAMSMSSMGGRHFQPKPGVSTGHESAELMTDVEAYLRRLWSHHYLEFQLMTDDPKVVHNFSIEREHPAIMLEAYAVLEKLL